MVGVVEDGLFLDMVNEVDVGDPNGPRTLINPEQGVSIREDIPVFGNDRVREARGRSVIGSRTPHVVYGRIYEIPAHIAACGNC